MDQVTIVVPASTANNGPGYDIWSIGLKSPQLRLTYTRKRRPGIEVAVRSRVSAPPGRILGYTGKRALERFLSEHGIDEGAYLLYEDEGYAVGGLGRSGAEAVGAITAAAVLYKRRFSRQDIVIWSARGEPDEHKDNVAASTNGRFNIISISPLTGEACVDCYEVPEDLGIAIGFSSHTKGEGTAKAREVLRAPLEVEDFVVQAGLISAMTAALVTGNIERVLQLAWGDRFHELRRADSGAYGPFSYDEFRRIKVRLFEAFHVALVVSGAGPNIAVLYSKKEHPTGIVATISPVIVPWFQERGIHIDLHEMEIASEGAYDYAQRHYG